MVMMAKYGVPTGNFARQAYQKVDAQTASPGQILLKLYEGAIRFTKQAKQAIEDGDPGAKGQYISKTMAILDEFITALDHDASPELCGNLERLYLYLIYQLTHANTTMDPQPCQVVIEHLTTLHDAWEQAVKEAGG